MRAGHISGVPEHVSTAFGEKGVRDGNPGSPDSRIPYGVEIGLLTGRYFESSRAVRRSRLASAPDLQGGPPVLFIVTWLPFTRLAPFFAGEPLTVTRSPIFSVSRRQSSNPTESC